MALRVNIKPKPKYATETPAVTEEDEHTPTERGLLKVAGNQKQQISYLNAQISYLHKHFITRAIHEASLSCDYCHGNSECDEDDCNHLIVWDYLREFELWTLTSSRCYNVKSTVDWYENKKGELFKAHFSKHGKYLRRMKAGEEDGIYYNGQFPITKQSHYFKSPQEADVCTAERLEDCFEPIFPLEK